MGNKHRPFYRIVVQKSTAGRNSRAIEILGTYDPLLKDSKVKLASERALHWLMSGAQPTETVAILLKREGVLDEFFQARPKAQDGYKFLDKRTAAMSKQSAVSRTVEKAEEPAPVAEASATEAPAAEEAPVEEPAAEEAVAEEAAPEPSDAVAETPAEEEAKSE